MEGHIFTYDNRLGIHIPNLTREWDDYIKEEQLIILSQWESIRGSIPDRIKYLESQINQKQQQLDNEENFPLSCQLNSDIAELASIINDLWIWYRTHQGVSEKKHM
ncbi:MULTISPECIES: hypothetical protein [Bacillus]|uniref:hypothetical protein n=1 Tax=Bacillus TaxID=1386 RepID=UPI00031F0C05|nr:MULTISPECIES: hypothetical protein [Bacillus]